MAKKTIKKNIVAFRLNDKEMEKLEDLADAEEDEISANELARKIVQNSVKQRITKSLVKN